MFKPMLAATCKDMEALKFPVLVSPKLDGVRAVVKQAQLLSRSLKPIPNSNLQKHFSNALLEHLDGELITGQPTEGDVYCNTVSNVMSTGLDAPDVYFWVFDDSTEPERPFVDRYTKAAERVANLRALGFNVALVPHYECNNVTELLALEEDFLKSGYEGAMIRNYHGKYKYGRATEKSGDLLKLKRFFDGEAEVLYCNELFRNGNEAFTNELGLTSRSSVLTNMVAGECLGSFTVLDHTTGQTFNVGSGFTQQQRDYIWIEREKWVGRFIKYRYFPTGSKEKPRFPTYIGWRDMDLDNS